MKVTLFAAAAVAQLAYGQATLDFVAIDNAPAPTATSPPETNTINFAAVETSLSAEVQPATATSGPSAVKFRRDAEPFFNNPSSLVCRWFPSKCQPPKPQVKPCSWLPWAWNKCQASKPDPKPTPQPQPEPYPQPQPPSCTTKCGGTSPTPTTPPPQDNKCNAQPVGAGPAVNPDDADTFVSFPAFSEAALSAVTPSGYTQQYQDLKAAYQGNNYLTYKDLTSYSPSDCAAFCDETKGCYSFGIYFERGPSLAPGPNCPNPASTTLIRCALHGSTIDAKGATNDGQWRESFRVVIAGSNGYSKPNAPADVPGHPNPTPAPGGPGEQCKPWNLPGTDKFFAGPFVPDLCRILAKVQTAKNKEYAISKGLKTYSPCNSFNAFEVWKNEVMVGTYCKLFTDGLQSSWFDFKGGFNGDNSYTCKNSWIYTLSSKDLGKL